jgi:hypothetical protein
LTPNWGYGPLPSGDNALSVQLGIVSVLVLIAAAFYMIFKKSKDKIIASLTALTIAVVVLMTKYSLFLWQGIPGLDTVQFPWRLLSITVFSTAIMSAFVIEQTKKKMLSAALVIAISIISTISYTKPYAFTDKGDSFYSTNEDTTTVRDEYMPLWVEEKPPERANEKIIADPQIVQFKSKEIKPANYNVSISAKEESDITVNSIYFPGWKVDVSGQNVPINYSNKFGLITFRLPRGDHEVIIKYARSGLHALSELISLAALFTAVAFFIRWRRQDF